MNVQTPPPHFTDWLDRRSGRERIREFVRKEVNETLNRRAVLQAGFGPITLRDREYKRMLARRILAERMAGLRDFASISRRGVLQGARSLDSAGRMGLRAFGSPRLRLLAVLGLFILFPVAVHVAFPETTEAGAGQLVRTFYPSGERIAASYRRRLDCASLHPVRAGDGSSAGWHRQPDCKPEETPELRVTPLSDDEILHILPYYEIVEGQAGIGRETLLGVNLLGLARAAKSWIQAWFGGRGAVVGGSSMSTSALELLLDQPTPADKWEKLGRLRDTAIISAFWLTDDPERARFSLSGMPCIGRLRGGPFHGPVSGGFCARIFGRDSLLDLTPAELCLLAVSPQRPILYPGTNAPRELHTRVAERFARLRERAITRCVEPMLQAGRITADDAATMREEITSFRLPVDLDTDPERMLSAALPGASPSLRRMAPAGGPIGIVDLTLLPEVQQGIAGAIRAFEKRILPRISDGLCIGNCTEGEHRVDVLVAVVEIGEEGTDSLVGLFETRPGLFSGPEGAVPTRSLGSVPKYLALPILIEKGLSTKRICRRRFAGLHDWNGSTGFDCSKASHFMSLYDVLRISSNLGIAEATLLAGTSAVRNYFERIGIFVGPRSTKAMLRRDMATGVNVLLSPQTALRAFVAQVRGGKGAPAVAAPVTPFGAVGPDNPEALDLSTLTTRRALEESFRIGHAPFENGGTLQMLRAPLRSFGCSELVGKSGTSDSNVRDQYRDRLTMLSAFCNGRRLAFFVLAGSPEIDVPLGRIDSRAFPDLVIDVVSAAATASFPTTPKRRSP